MKKFAIFLIGLLCILINLCSCGSSTKGGGGDNGSLIEIKTVSLPSGQTNFIYSAKIDVVGGSGEYIYNINEMPEGLSINETGEIKGTIIAEPGIYTIYIKIIDKNYQNNFSEKEIEIEVLELMSDIYENDNNFPTQESANNFKPSDTIQEHTFHENNDIDYITVDLNDIDPGDEIMIETGYLTSQTDTNITLYDSYRVLLVNNNDIKTNDNLYSRIMFECINKGLYFLKIESWGNNIGDYTLNIINTKKKLEINNHNLKNGTVDNNYNEQITAKGGSGTYIFKASGLPKDIFINENTGVISGQLNDEAGEYEIIINIADKEYPSKNISKIFKLDIYESLSINTQTIKDAKINSDYSYDISISGGSGNYLFTSINLPKNLQINPLNGNIYGSVTDSVGLYNIVISVKDNITFQTFDKNYTIQINQFYPDNHENDNNINTVNSIKIGESQEHTLNSIYDVDFIKLDLSNISSGDVIKIETSQLTTLTDTNLTLYSPEKNIITTDNDSGGNTYSNIFFECLSPGIYYLKIDSATHTTGDYKISIINTGPKVKIVNENFTDALRSGPYNQKINVVGGSGNYKYISSNLPANITLNQEGLLSGNIAVNTGTYSFQITVEDLLYTGIKDEKMFNLNVVDFYPDEYEPDNNTEQAKNISPGEINERNFNNINDVDYIKIDLSRVSIGDVIKIETSQLKVLTDTNISLYDTDMTLITSDNNGGIAPYSLLIYQCNRPGIYYLKIDNAQGRTGDYQLTVTNTGEKLSITKTNLKDALKNANYEEIISVTGGSGNYKYNISNQPGNLTLSQNGNLSGEITAVPGEYMLTVTVEDTLYSGIKEEKMLNLKIVEFYPDNYENDGDFNSAKEIKPNEEQYRTFNITNDYDYIVMNLTGVIPGDVIKVETSFLTEETDTLISVYDNNRGLITADNDSGQNKYSKIIFTCSIPTIYYLLLQEMVGDVGDYKLEITNTGHQLAINNDRMADALKNANYEEKINVTGGSGNYTFSTDNLPSGLSIDNQGFIKGAASEPGDYNFTISVHDLINSENNASKNIELRVAEFSPDSFENDNNLTLAKSINVGDSQDHNFNMNGDIDFVRIDMNNVNAGDVIIIKTSQLTKITDTNITLYNEGYGIIANNDNADGDYSKITYQCNIPGIYYLKIENTFLNTGDYRLSVVNSGQKIQISTNTLPDAEQERIYSQNIQSSGGSGNFTYTRISGTLPSGLFLNSSTGQVSGILSGFDLNYNFTIQVIDNLNPENNSTKEFSITTFRGVKILSTLFNSYQLPRPRQASERLTVTNKRNWDLISVRSFQCGNYINNYFRAGEIVEIIEEASGSYPGGNRGIRIIESIEPQSGTNHSIVRLNAPIELRNWWPILRTTTVLERMYVDTIFPESSDKRTDRVQFELKFPNGRQTATTIFPCYYNENTRVDLDPINISSATASDTLVRTYDLPSSGVWKVGIAQTPEWTANPENGKCVVTMSGSSF